MPVFRIEQMPSRKIESDTVVYYVRDQATNKLLTKFDTAIEKADDIEGWETFNSEQKLELQNFVANVRFVIHKLNMPAKLNRAYRLSLPVPLQNSLLELAELSAKHNIQFDPMTAMLNGLLNHIKATEKRLAAFSETTSLAQYNIDSHTEKKEASETEKRKYNKKIFKRLLATPDYLEKYAKIASGLYHKETNLNSSTAARYAEGKAKASLWSVSCGLTVLGQERADVVSIVPLPVLISLWLVPLKFSGKITRTEQAVSLFKKTFVLDKAAYDNAAELIKTEMNSAI